MSDIVSADLNGRRAPLTARSMPLTARRESERSQPPEPTPSTQGARRKAAHYSKLPFQSVGALIFGAIIVVVLLIGWQNRHEKYLTPEDGLGYQLGIAGAVMMLVLLLYPLRKKLSVLGRIGRVSHWFKLHMLLGILGPVLILFHSNFQLGSTNSSIALIAMLTVAISGLIGRQIYTRIHMGLYGKKARVAEIMADTQVFKRAIGEDLNDFEPIERKLKEYENKVLVPYHGLLVSVWSVFILGPRSYLCRRSILRQARALMDTQAWSRRERRSHMRSVENHLLEYFAAVRKAAQFAFFERLFSLWHLLHLPMFFFLITATIIHIIAVHLY